MGRAKRTSLVFKNVSRMNSIRDNYFHCEAALRNKFRLADSQSFQLTLYEEYIRDVDNAFLLLDALDQKIIHNEFFFNDDRMWWVGTYSRSTFYRLRRKAVEHFLGAFYGK